MAKLGSYFGLCPLIDHKSLLGVSEDVTPGCVIVTLGKNMAIKYKLSDQKQIHSWSSKDKLSSPVIYDRKEGRYVAAFNHIFVRFWNENEQNLEKLKKTKFPLPIHTLIQTETDPIIIFKNGKVMTLSYALEVRKELSQQDIFDKSSTIIEDYTCIKVEDQYYTSLLVKSDKSFDCIWTLPENRVGDDTMKNLRKIKVDRPGFKLNGHLIMQTDNGPTLFTLWSDGRLYSQSLNKDTPENFYSVIETLSRKQPVCLLALNSSYFAMYGADANQEGASLQIYNIQFKITQAKLSLKLYTVGSKLWLIGSNMLVTVGQNLAVVPFHLDTEQLAALVGSHKLATVADDEDVAIVTELVEENWGEEKSEENLNKSLSDSTIKTQVSELVKEGWSEVAICEEIFPKLFEKRDTRTILSSLDYFTDIPENILVKVLSYAVQQYIKNNKNPDITNKGIKGQYGMLLNRILSISYSDVLLLPKLRTGLKFDEVLILLQYICYLLSENGQILPNLDITESERKIVEWGSILLDAHYQQFLLSKDSKIIECLQYFMALVDSYLLCMDGFKKIEPVLCQLQKGKNTTKITNTYSLKYSIEYLKLY